MRALRTGRRILLVTLCAAALPAAGAQATIIGLGAQADEPSECVEPRAKTASTHCQLFAGTPIRIFATASDEDGMTRLQPQPFTLVRLERGKPPAPVVSWTQLDDNDADDDPTVTPARNTDYQARFGGNESLPPGDSATLITQVGRRIQIPTVSATGSNRVRVPVIVSQGPRGRLELRRCRKPKEFAARACAGRRGHDVVARRTVRRPGRHAFAIAMPPRTLRRYEVAFRPARSGRFAVTRQAFQLLRGFDGRTSYRYVVRANPFGTR